MNKYYYRDRDGNTPPPTTITGFAFSDAVIQRKCPTCNSDPGFQCETPKGLKAWPPHLSRINLKETQKPS